VLLEAEQALKLAAWPERKRVQTTKYILSVSSCTAMKKKKQRDL
jgi:hypothetical protein